jgi:hypothetical protein
MKTNAVSLLLVLTLCLSCKRTDDGFDAGGPISRYLLGRWQLEKVITPSGTKTGPQIGYAEIYEHGNDNVDNYDKVFRDGSLVATYTWLRPPATVSKAQDMTVIVSYWGSAGAKRYFKIRRDPVKTTLEATAYVTELGSAQDSVRYFYTYIGR